MQFPAIHIGGSSKKTLLEDVLECRSKVSAALGVLSQCGPNMRDYYVLPDGSEAYQRARIEHEARMMGLRDTVAEFDLLAYGIDQGGAFVVKVVDGEIVKL